MENRWKKTDERNVLEVKEKAGVTYLSYPLLEHTKCVRHAFSTRLGGVSEGIYASMNLSFSRGDDPEAVRENFYRMAEVLEISPEQYVFSAQTHTTNVRKVTKDDAGKGFLFPQACITGCAGGLKDVDGLVTNEPGLCLATFYADCVPLFFVDPVKKVIGLSHSGWRGTVAKIGKETVRKMREVYGCDPGDILAAVGPSICQDCYEVSEEVIRQFQEHFSEKDWASCFIRKKNGKYQMDLWRANEMIFLESGIKTEHIAVTNICTHCNSEVLYSHRAMGDQRGNLAAFLALNEET